MHARARVLTPARVLEPQAQDESALASDFAEFIQKLEDPRAGALNDMIQVCSYVHVRVHMHVFLFFVCARVHGVRVQGL